MGAGGGQMGAGGSQWVLGGSRCPPWLRVVPPSISTPPQFCQLGNFSIHVALRNLRPAGEGTPVGTEHMGHAWGHGTRVGTHDTHGDTGHVGHTSGHRMCMGTCGHTGHVGTEDMWDMWGHGTQVWTWDTGHMWVCATLAGAWDTWAHGTCVGTWDVHGDVGHMGTECVGHKTWDTRRVWTHVGYVCGHKTHMGTQNTHETCMGTWAMCANMGHAWGHLWTWCVAMLGVGCTRRAHGHAHVCENPNWAGWGGSCSRDSTCVSVHTRMDGHPGPAAAHACGGVPMGRGGCGVAQGWGTRLWECVTSVTCL